MPIKKTARRARAHCTISIPRIAPWRRSGRAGYWYVDLESASLLFCPLVGAHCDPCIGDSETDIVFVQSNLLIVTSPRTLVIQYFTDFVDLLPLEQSLFDGLEYIA